MRSRSARVKTDRPPTTRSDPPQDRDRAVRATGSTRLLRAPVEEGAAHGVERVTGVVAVLDATVERAMQDIRQIVTDTVARGADLVGAYVLKTFYDDDPAAYTSKSHHKHASLNRLIAHCGTSELPVSRTFLSLAIRMAVVTRSLPADARFAQLPFSHRAELLKLSSHETIEAVSCEALEKNSTVRDVRAQVADLKAKRRPGRSPAKTVLRNVRRAVASLQPKHASGAAFREDELEALTAGERAQIQREIDRASEALAGLRKAVRGR